MVDKGNITKFWILKALSKGTGISEVDLFYKYKPDVIHLDFNELVNFMNNLRSSGEIKREGIHSFVTGKGAKTMRDLRFKLGGDKIYYELLQRMPELEFRDRLANLEIVVMGALLLAFTSFLLKANPLVFGSYSPYIWFSLYVIFIGIVASRLPQVTFLVLNNLTSAVKDNVLDYYEKNRRWIAIATPLLLIFIVILMASQVFDFGLREILRGLLIPAIFFMIVNAKKIYSYLNKRTGSA